jgi:hypothetical protein
MGGSFSRPTTSVVTDAKRRKKYRFNAGAGDARSMDVTGACFPGLKPRSSSCAFESKIEAAEGGDGAPTDGEDGGEDIDGC